MTLKPTTLSAFEEVDLMSLQKQAKKLRMAEGLREDPWVAAADGGGR